MRISLTSVLVDDQARALAFYTDKLGFVLKDDMPLGEHPWLTVVSPDGSDGAKLLLEPDVHQAAKPFREALVRDGIPATSFAVDDVFAEHARLTIVDLTKDLYAGQAVIIVDHEADRDVCPARHGDVRGRGKDCHPRRLVRQCDKPAALGLRLAAAVLGVKLNVIAGGAGKREGPFEGRLRREREGLAFEFVAARLEHEDGLLQGH